MNRWTANSVTGAVAAIMTIAAAFLAPARAQGHMADDAAATSSAAPRSFMRVAAETGTIAPGANYGPYYAGTVGAESEVAYSDFRARLGKKEVRAVTLEGRSITGEWIGGGRFRTYAPEDPTLIERLLASRVAVSVTPTRDEPSQGLLTTWLLLLLLAGASVFLLREAPSGGGTQLGIGRSRARLIVEPTHRLTFADVAGIDEARQELAEIVEFLKHPAKFRAIGARIPRGCLLAGPPGTGKTQLARAIAGEANVPFFTVSGSDFVEIFVGIGASRVRDMFAEARNHAPCIIFIDEIDAVGRRRGAGLGSGSDEREQTLNQLLVEMDGFDGNQGIVVMAATNRPDVLDPALLRPGRFDRQVVVPSPDLAGRKQILDLHLRKIPLADDVDAQAIACGTPGMSGAELANLVNEAALLAARTGRVAVGMTELEAAKDKVLLGPERRSAAMNVEDRERTAYHEAGHALVALSVPGNDPVHKVTIVPHGRALGMTLSLPVHDRHWLSRQEAEARIAMLLGGRVAEELIYGQDGVTSAAADDIGGATALARRMVTEFGFSEALGPLCFGEGEDRPYLGRQPIVSQGTAATVDHEIRRIIRQGEATARCVLAGDLNALHRLARALIARETLSADEIHSVLRDERSEARADDAHAVCCPT